jgi:hypothetical protein
MTKPERGVLSLDGNADPTSQFVLVSLRIVWHTLSGVSKPNFLTLWNKTGEVATKSNDAKTTSFFVILALVTLLESRTVKTVAIAYCSKL